MKYTIRGQVRRDGPSGQAWKYTFWHRWSSLPLSSSAWPSYWRFFLPPSRHERTGGPGDEVGIFSRVLYRVEDDLQVFGDGDADQSGLRGAGVSDGAEDAEFALDQEFVKICLGHIPSCQLEGSNDHTFGRRDWS